MTTDTQDQTVSDATMNASALSNMHCAPLAALFDAQELATTMRDVLNQWKAAAPADDDLVDLVQLDEGLVAAPTQATSITRNYGFNDYHQTMAFVRAISATIHREDHHPVLIVTYKECIVTFSTHSAGGVTLNDLICAAKCDAIYDAHRAKSIG